MTPEIQALQKRIDELEYLLNQFIKPDKYFIGKTFQTSTSGIKMGFFGATPIVQPSSSAGAADHTGAGGTTVTTSMLFDGNLGGKGYGIGDIVTNLKNLGLFKL